MKILPVHYSYLQIQNNIQQPQNSTRPVPDRISDGKICLSGYKYVYRDLVNFKGAEKDFGFISNRPEKQEIELKFLEPLLRQNSRKGKKMPPIFMLAGTSDDEINLFKDYISNRIVGKNIQIIDLTGIPKELFEKDVKRILWDSKTQYLQNKTKTIVYIENADNFFGVNSVDAESTLDFYLTDAEKKLTVQNDYNQIIVNLMKGVADYCSEEPVGMSDKGNALTFLITSKVPHLVNQDLLTRDGKLQYVYVDYPDKVNIAAVLQDSVDRDREYLGQLKVLSLKDIEDLDMPFETWQNLYNLKRNNKLYLLSIENNVPVKLFSNFCVPDETSGAFSTGGLQKSSREALYRYIAEPQKSYSEHLAEVLAQGGRDVSQETYNNSIRIKKILNKAITKPDSEMLRELFEVCNLSVRERQQLAEMLVDDNIKRISLLHKENSSGLNSRERQELDRLCVLTINDSDIKKDLAPEMVEYINARTYKLSNGRYKLGYGNQKEDSVNLYLGNFGTNPKVLWVDSTNPEKIEVVKFLIKELKILPQFRSVERLEFSQPAESLNIKNAVKTDRLTLDYRPIYTIKVM